MAGKPEQKRHIYYNPLKLKGRFRNALEKIYSIKGDEIIILKIGHRKEVYLRVLPRMNWQ